MYSQFASLIALVILSAVFSGSETALISVTSSKVDELVAKKVRNSKLLQKLKRDPHRLLITVLIGNNLVNIGASAYAAIVFTDLYGSSGVGIATGVMTFFILLFGEITPKSFAQQHSVGFSLFMSWPIYILQFIFFPFVWVFEKLVVLANRLFGGKKSYTVTEGELVAMLKIGTKEGSIEKQEREFIENILEFNDIQVKEVMTPRVAIEALDINMTLHEVVDYIKKHSHSRLPIYDGDLDHIVGIISIKEILQYFDEHSSNKKLKSLNYSVPLEVPATQKIDRLFREFQRRHLHIAIVIDKYGGTAGLVTLEDLLEEIVGEILDESDVHEKPIEVINKKTIIASGKALVGDVNDFFKVIFGPNDRETINSLILDHIHRFPREGDIIDFPHGKVEVLKIKENVVDKVKITKKKIKRKKIQ